MEEDNIEQITMETLRYIVAEQYKRTGEKTQFDKFLDGLEKFRKMSRFNFYNTTKRTISSTIRDTMIRNGANLPKPLTDDDLLYKDKTPKF